ncbi:hypothetical protein NEIELOOT_02235 [Neisseria elongata subsp. glycolytica ATCC 29315]|uniref:Uncharacterized protein n=1 Tax=Neisseria elongata subsp. glycolytica ATCC 29315 TaxID=546263 RepID=D4DT34_NEIEG|nr:hypothetical protein NEIELOOT_02235 [Neisseria elongata subsp. glycolytica ATCC 29315]
MLLQLYPLIAVYCAITHNQLWLHQPSVLLPNGKGTARLPLQQRGRLKPDCRHNGLT